MNDKLQLYTSLANEYGNGWSPLLEACSQEDYETVSELVQNGADVNAADNFGVTPLDRAARYAYENEANATKIVSLLLLNGADVNARNSDGETALMQAVYYNYVALARLLLDSGADVNSRNTEGNTVISIMEESPSLFRNRKRITKMLEEAGGVR